MAERYGRGSEGPCHFYFKQLVRKLVGFAGHSNLFKLDQDQPDSEITPDYVTNKLVIAGTVNSVVDQILAFRETTGDFGTLYCHWQHFSRKDSKDAGLTPKMAAFRAQIDARVISIFRRIDPRPGSPSVLGRPLQSRQIPAHNYIDQH